MPCCETILKTFVNQATTIIPYVGDKPTVTVSYLIDGVWQAAGVVSSIILSPTSILIDHGGASTGVIKVTQ